MTSLRCSDPAAQQQTELINTLQKRGGGDGEANRMKGHQTEQQLIISSSPGQAEAPDYVQRWYLLVMNLTASLMALKGSLAAMLPDLLLAARRAWKSPWRRSYSRSKRAKWETEADYCSGGKTTAPYDKGMRLVDFIDLAILDYLMSTFRVQHGLLYVSFRHV
ncbi:hypothetical protein CRUP_016584 [Coryphaenoides rupestris]|nr:hypothetical protein CRUP_016584 [Coryphaenoides rupestris]